MAQTELLTVEQVLQLQGIGLTIMPDFSIPKAGWKNSTQQVHIVKPNGEKLEANANFQVWHFNVRDSSVPLDKRWRVVISFPSLEGDLPVGSKILGDSTTAATLLY
jgi:hypothetical protein